jgi:DNA-directed RNA polymerase specialized sigma24 family protein
MVPRLAQGGCEVFFGPFLHLQRVPIRKALTGEDKERLDLSTHVEDVDKEIKNGLLGTEQQQCEAVEKAYERYAKPLASFIREKVAPTLDSHELSTAVDEVFLGLARSAAKGKITTGGYLGTLLFKMARRKAYDQLRAKTRHDSRFTSLDDDDDCDNVMTDDEFSSRVRERLAASPQIAALWRTAAENGAANEIIRMFRLWLSNLPRLQRKVAQALFVHFGDITDHEICDDLAKTGERPSVASVKSARKQIIEKFKSYMEIRERVKK